MLTARSWLLTDKVNQDSVAIIEKAQLLLFSGIFCSPNSSHMVQKGKRFPSEELNYYFQLCNN